MQLGYDPEFAIANSIPPESQLRPLKSVPEEERKAIWEEATRKAVSTANEFEIPDRWEKLFLPLPRIVYRALATLEFSAKTIARIVESVEAQRDELERTVKY